MILMTTKMKVNFLYFIKYSKHLTTYYKKFNKILVKYFSCFSFDIVVNIFFCFTMKFFFNII